MVKFEKNRITHYGDMADLKSEKSQNGLFSVFYEKIAYVHVFLENNTCSYEESICVLDTPLHGNAFGII